MREQKRQDKCWEQGGYYFFYIWDGSAFLSLKSNIKIDYIYVDRKWLIPFGSLKTGIPNKERTNEREEKVFRITIINGYTEQ